jgi:hypothetical protein
MKLQLSENISVLGVDQGTGLWAHAA